ncbi:LysR substrate-binding domain-containing protein [Bordetella sp. BOR01]|uniref:LysR substrate-binding domain-containing protein n=1 Tax=Bordetella sp. BOR01 TaxID=2854779 RepID=UPI001C438263|nr:LysR substrate-binding domain-containing protein [Bordetella sp. BOR01]MBV7484354.1 LysR family transcriptional regulator [Bordetella sp. BOR01]
MNFRQLKYFVKIVELGGMTRAAQMLFVAQPALSQQIANLEAELGVRLLDRNVHGVMPTSEGEVLYRHARTILRQVDNTRALLMQKDEDVTGKVSIGMPSSTGRVLALPLFQRVREAYPGILVEIVDVPSADLTGLAAQGRVDMSITPDQLPKRGLQVLPVLLEEIYVILHPGMAVSADPMPLAELAQIPLILPSLPNTLRTRVEHVFQQARLEYKLAGEASTSAILIPAVKAGMAATLLPWSAVNEDVRAGALRVVRLPPPTFFRELSICTSSSLPFTQAAQKVKDICLALCRDLVSSGQWAGSRMME